MNQGTSGRAPVAGSGRVLIREPGRWSLTAPGAGDPVDVSLAEVLGFLDPCATATDGWTPIAARMITVEVPAVDRDAVLTPSAACALVAVAGRIGASDREGRLHTLDPLALAVLDALRAPQTATDLHAALTRDGAGPAVEAVAAAAAVLAATGLVAVTGPPTEPAPVTVDATAGAEPGEAVESRDDRAAAAEPAPATFASRLARRFRSRVGPPATAPPSVAPPTDAGPPAPTAPPAPAAPTAPAHLESLAEHVALGRCGNRVPVFGFFGDDYPPPLSLGVLASAVRAHDGGALNDTYCVHPLARADEVLAALEAHRGPAVLLCSNYVWSVDFVRDFVAKAKAANPEILAIHGGPSTPAYVADARRFCHDASVDVATRGESEASLPRVLAALAPGLPTWDLDLLESVAGLSYWNGNRFVRTEDAERLADPGEVPSPWLTGEFDHIEPGRLNPATIETNRGCPYGCTFCDWGSATNSRLRFFEMDRIKAELEHFASRGIKTWMIADANFGITSRDVAITEEIVRLREQHGVPHLLAFCVAKNTTKHLTRIVELLVGAGIFINTSLSLQTRDAETLAVVDRANISVDKYDELTASFRRHGLPLVCDLLLGLPGATVESYRDDVQFCLDHNLTPRTFPVQIIPNAPMNDPEYRKRFDLVVNEGKIVVASSTFTVEDHAEMMRLRTANQVFDHFGVARLLLRHLQWDHDLPMALVLHRIVRTTVERPDAYPLLAWLMEYFELFLVPPVSWRALYEELSRFVAAELSVEADSAMAAVIEAQLLVMPDHHRSFPDGAVLDHDVAAYWLDGCRSLEDDGTAASGARPLRSYGPARLDVLGDPCRICTRGLVRVSERRDEPLSPADFWQFRHFELDSPLARNVPGFASPESYLQLIP